MIDQTDEMDRMDQMDWLDLDQKDHEEYQWGVTIEPVHEWTERATMKRVTMGNIVSDRSIRRVDWNQSD